MNASNSGVSSTLLMLTGGFGEEGGIQAYNRLLVQAFQEHARSRGAASDALLLRDSQAEIDAACPGGVQAIGFRRSAARFSLAAVRKARATRPSLLVFGHVNFAPLALVLGRFLPGTPQWFVVFGVEAWRRVSWPKRLALRRADRIISISEYTRRRLAATNGIDPTKIVILPCALDPLWADEVEALAASAALEDVRPVLLTVGRLDASEGAKGVGRVIQALPSIARRFPDVRYIVVGEGTATVALRRLAEEVGVPARVEFRGRVDRRQLAEAYREASLFVMPSKAEGFGIVFIEAALFGRPSVAGNAGGAPEVVIEGVTGALADPDDVEGIAHHVISLLSSPATIRSLGANARTRARERYGYAEFSRSVAAYLDSRS